MTKKKSVEKSNPECRRSLTDRSELQKFVLHLLQGTMIGIGAVLPGISGGVLSVVFGIYEPIMAFFVTFISLGALNCSTTKPGI